MSYARTHTLAALCVVACAGAARANPTATFTPLGFLAPSDFASRAYAVSSDGSVVVGSSQSATASQAWFWTAAGGMIGLGDLPGGDFNSFATACSSDGSVVVGTASDALGPVAFRWTAATGLVSLGGLPGGDGRSNATGVSADGSVVVGSSTTAAGYSAFRWTSAQGMVSLGVLPGGDSLSAAEGVSADGSVVYGYSAAPSGFRAFRWTSTDGLAALASADGKTPESDAYAASASGGVLVGYRQGDYGPEGFRWTLATGMQSSNELYAFPFLSNANAANGDATLLAGDYVLDNSTRAATWDPAYALSDFFDMLWNEYGLSQQLAGWSLISIYGVSADGRVVVGVGYNPSGQTEAWRVAFDQNCRPPSLRSYSGDAYIPQGDRADITAEVRSLAPLTCVWTKDGVVLSNSDKYAGADTTNLSVFDFLPSDAGVYRLVASNDCGTQIVPDMNLFAREPCPIDYNRDGSVNPDDLGDYITDYFIYAGRFDVSYPAPLDFNLDGFLNPDDIGDFITAYFTGSCLQ